jgi:hypothetical protein
VFSGRIRVCNSSHRSHQACRRPILQSRTEADLAKGALEDAGMQAMVQADTAGGMRSTLRGPARGLRFLCTKKTQPQRGTCSLLLPRVTKALTRTPKPTATRAPQWRGFTQVFNLALDS